jgi:hypothetical protein
MLAYSSWLALPFLAVLLGRRSENNVSIDQTSAMLKKHTLVDVGEDTALGDGDVTEKLVQLLIVTDGELEMTRDDTSLLVVTSGVTGQLKDLSSQVLKDGSEVNGSTCKTRQKPNNENIEDACNLPAPTR